MLLCARQHQACMCACICLHTTSKLCCPRVCTSTKCTNMRACNSKAFCWNMCAQGERLQVTSACCSGQSKLQRNTKQNGLATENDIVGACAHKAKHCKCQVLVAQVNQSCKGTQHKMDFPPSLPTKHFCAFTCAHAGHAHEVALSACCCVQDNIRRACMHLFAHNKQALLSTCVHFNKVHQQESLQQQSI